MVPAAPPGALPVFGGAIVLGLIHGAEPGHGWPIAATYALDRRHPWRRGLLASALLGLGHLVSSLVVVAGFLLAESLLGFERFTEPVSVAGIAVGGPIGLIAGILLVALGIREYRRGHVHAYGGHGREPDGHSHTHDDGAHGPHSTVHANRTGLAGLVWTAFALGFVHEEEVEIIGLCLGSSLCLELMIVYAVAVLLALVGLTLLLVAGYERYEDRVGRYAASFPTISAVVLVTMGFGFALGLL